MLFLITLAVSLMFFFAFRDKDDKPQTSAIGVGVKEGGK